MTNYIVNMLTATKIKKNFWISFGLSFLTFAALEWWPMAINEYLAGIINSICSFALTWYCLDKFKVDGETAFLSICGALLLGRWLPQLPMHILFYCSTLYYAYLLVLATVGILLGAICYYEKKLYAFVLSLIILIVMNTITQYIWLDTIDFIMGISSDI